MNASQSCQNGSRFPIGAQQALHGQLIGFLGAHVNVGEPARNQVCSIFPAALKDHKHTDFDPKLCFNTTDVSSDT